MGKRRESAASAAQQGDAREEPLRFTRRHERLTTDEIEPSEMNPRRHRGRDDAKIAELAESIERVGVLEPLLVRERSDGRVEILAGERRWRASIIAAQRVPERGELDVIVLDVPDDVALEIMVVENDQREDPHPLDQCDGFVMLRDRFGRSVEQIAAKISRPPRYVYDRLRLEQLGAVGREAFLDGRFGLGVALALSRLGNATIQERTTAELLKQWQAQEIPISAAKAAVMKRMMYIARASFDPSDPELVPAAGSCTTCVKRSGNQGELFAELFAEFDLDDRCTDAGCWDDKEQADWQARARAAEEGGLLVATAKESKEIFPNQWGAAAKGYVELDSRDHTTEGKTWRELLGPERLATVQITLARGADGTPKEVAKRADLLEAMRVAPSSRDPEGLVAEPANGKAAKGIDSWQLDSMIRAETERRLTAAIVQAIELGGHNSLEFWRALTRIVIRNEVLNDPDAGFDVIKRRGLHVGDDGLPVEVDNFNGDEEEVLVRAAADMKPAQLLGLIVEFTIGFDVVRDDTEGSVGMGLIAALNVDRKHHAREAAKHVKAEQRAKEKAKREAEKEKAASVGKGAKKSKSRKEIDAEEADAKREQMEDAGYAD